MDGLTTGGTQVPAGTFDSLEPGTGRHIAAFPVTGADEVAAVVRRARVAADWWSRLDPRARAAKLRAIRSVFARRLGEIADLIARENGKPRPDAVLEVVQACDQLDWLARNAGRVLHPTRVRPPLLLAGTAAWHTYEPFGVIGVIGPWNYPVHTPIGVIGPALAAGNTVVFKPSEYTPAVGVLLGELVRQAVPEQPILQVVTGLGETGAALCRAGVDKIAFTGSGPTGRKIMATCAETLTPVLLELGGKDAMLVDADADLAKAARAAVWGGFTNSGQACVGLERAYVVSDVYEPFLDQVRDLVDQIDPVRDLGPMTMPAQVDVVRRHIADALARGARIGAGDASWVQDTNSPGDGRIPPLVLVDVPSDALVLREETFGPVLPVLRVPDIDAAVLRANASRFGLGASVWTGSAQRGRQIAARLRTGMVAINGALVFAAVPGLPFGGVGESGFGRAHGPDGLREFSRSKAVTRAARFAPADVFGFDRPRWAVPAAAWLTRVRYVRPIGTVAVATAVRRGDRSHSGQPA